MNAEQESAEKEREEYGKKRVWEDCKHGRWLSPCPICKAEKDLTELKRDHFIRTDVDGYHYYYSFSFPGLEICLEPCAGGFDVAAYTDIIASVERKPADHLTAISGIRPAPTDSKSLVEPKRCTETGDYTQIDALFGDRKDEDWNKALSIANELFVKFAEKHIRDGCESRVRELLDMYPAGIPAIPVTGMKCMFCGCTDNNACPGGCSWVELNVCSRCKDRLNGNDLISGDEIKALRTRAKTITMKDGLRLRMQGGFIPVIPMEIKSGYGISLTIIHNPPDWNPIEIFSVGAVRGMPDPADSESIATAVLGKGYAPLPSLIPSSRMVHFFKRRE